jgi:hypothetical protein
MNSHATSPALPIAHAVLRVLIVVNWLYGAALVVLLFLTPNEQWIMQAFKLSPSPDTDRLIAAMQAMVVVGIASVPLNYAVLKRLLGIVKTVREGNPFLAANAQRLQVIAWLLVTLQVLSMIVGALARSVWTPEHPVSVNAGFSINGWLAVLLTFLLARVFAEGARMRDDLEGTV